ncbi:MAG: aldo/keto reductase [Clostridia bacterium]|nr:aldo/keto reductase [Clostridia bacterium]
MKKIKLGKTKIEVSEIGFGVSPMGPHQVGLSVEEGSKVLSHALDRGISFLDTAQFYQTYPHIKEALKGRRPVISSKSLAEDYEGMKMAVEEALHCFGYVDIFLLHEVRTGDFEKRQGAWKYLVEAKEKGLVRAIGVSTHHVDVVEEMEKVNELDIIFPLVNYAGLGIRRGDEPGKLEDMEKAIRESKKGIYTMKAFGGGPLIHEYKKCLDYNRSLGATVIGFTSIKDVDDLFDYLDGKDVKVDTSKKIMRISRDSCLGCGRCIEKCNNKAISFSREDGLAIIDTDKCMTCGYCTPVCPVRAIVLY